MATTGLTVERIVFNGLEMSVSDSLGEIDAGEEENARISELIDFIDSTADVPVLLSTVSSQS